MNDEFVPLQGQAKGAESVFTCSLCGTRFTHGVRTCASCPLATGCDVVGCPNCGHSFPRRSRLVDWIRRLFGARGEQRSW